MRQSYEKLLKKNNVITLDVFFNLDVFFSLESEARSVVDSPFFNN